MKAIYTIFAIALLTSLTGCYPPADNEFCLVPTTNNPSVTNAKDSSPIPAIGY